MFNESDLKKLNNEQTEFIIIKKHSNTKHSVIFSFKSKRGKEYYLNFYIYNPYRPNETLINFQPQTITKEIKIVGSKIAHQLKELLSEKNEFRLKIISGVHKISFNPLVLTDIEEYINESKKRRKAGMKKAEVLALKNTIIQLYEEAKTKKLKDREDPNHFPSSVLLATGREVGYLVDMLKELDFATSRRWSRDYQIDFKFDGFQSSRDSLLYYFADELRKLGFKARVHTWYD